MVSALDLVPTIVMKSLVQANILIIATVFVAPERTKLKAVQWHYRDKVTIIAY